jgi:hypothetical protein
MLTHLRHWELVYALFNFGNDYNLDKRLSFIKDIINKETIYSLLWWPLLFTFTSIISYYLLQFFAEGIILGYKKWMRPALYQLLDRNKLATKSELAVERRTNKILIEKNGQLQNSLSDSIKIEEEQKIRIDYLRQQIEDHESLASSKDTEYQRIKEIYEHDGEISKNLGEIFAHGEIWTWVK